MQKVSSGTRLASMFIDHVANSFIIGIAAILLMLPSISKLMNVSHEQDDFNMLGGVTGYLLLIPFCLYFLKDSFNGRSIAKRVMKLQVVDNVTYEAASPLRCFIRNIFCALWPIEVIVTLFSPEKRIGDMVAGTKVVYFDNTITQNKVSYKEVVLAFLLAYLLMLAFYIPMNKWISKITAGSKVTVVESSYNEALSKEIEKMFADSLDDILLADVRAYDKIENDTLKYVSVILNLKENYLDNESQTEELERKTTELLYTKCPQDQYTGQIKYVYVEAGSMQMSTKHIGKEISKQPVK